MRIDVHAHILPQCFLDWVKQDRIAQVRLETLEDGRNKLFFGKAPHPCTSAFWDVKAQLANMNAHGIDRQAISVGPRLFFYDRDSQWTADFCHRCNQEILDRCHASAGRLIPVGGLPMQDAALAIKELIWLDSQGVTMVQVGTMVAERRLDDPAFLPVLQESARRHMVVMLHPLIENRDEQTRLHHLSNVAGNPYQTMAAAANLIAGGVLDHVPDLLVLLVHGGGALPYQVYRLDHAWQVRPQGEFPCKEKPSAYLRKNFLTDGLVFGQEPMTLLCQLMGEERVMFGTDAPYDMADYDQLERIPQEKHRRMIGYENAERWLRL